MKQRITLFVFFGLVSLILCSYRPGPAHDGGANATGSDGATHACGGGGCHGSSLSTGLGTTLEFDSAGVPVSVYYPGISYTVKITATNATGLTLPKFGFQLTSVTDASAGTGTPAQAGTWPSTGLPTGVRYTTTAQSGLSTPFIEQSAFLSPSSGTGGAGTVYTETISWTAPAAGTGTVQFFGTIQAVNATGNESGDKSQSAIPVVITEVVSCPSVSISATTTTLTASPSGATSYTWYLNGSPVSGATSSTYTPVASGSYTVDVASAGGCTGTSNAVAFTVAGINEPSLAAALQVYPTITGGTVNVKINGTMGALTYQVYSLDGRIYEKGTIAAGSSSAIIDMNKLGSGLYLINIADQSRTATYKIVKQ
ncbi:MAG: hypothetical protein JWO03_1338 [Bacteroidetes bacterium]|nr:hypothetical protein [Bacteroidota bacterium]